MQESSSAQRLGFTLPDFKRTAWTSDQAKSVWEPRMHALAQKRLPVRLRMLQAGYASCLVQQLAAWEYLMIQELLHGTGFHHSILETINAYEPEKIKMGFVKPIFFKIVIGEKKNVELFEEAYRSADFFAAGNLLNIPSCCSKFYQATHIEKGWTDIAWFRALNTSGLSHTGDVADVSFLPPLNTFWEEMGISAVAHKPCSFKCTASENMGKLFFETGGSLGIHQEMEWLQNILSWPVEWSALHGIAEIKTPVLRISTNTDATAQKQVIRLQSDQYPEEGAKGLHFPFQQPLFKRITGSKSFQKGLDNKI